MKNNYDNIAGIYDFLSRLIFGTAIRKSQASLIRHIESGSKILIVGGGTGWILEEICKIHENELSISYIEMSVKMIERAKKRNCKENEVKFINCAIEDFVSDEPFHTVFTPFLFDNFREEKAGLVFNKINSLLLEGGQWLHVDFVLKASSPAWQKVLLKAMYLLFRLVCNIEAAKLPEMEGRFNSYHYYLVLSQPFFSGFIWASLYKKPER